MKKILYAIPILILLLLPIAPVYAFTGNLDGRVVFGQSFTLQSGQTLEGDLVVFGGEATIEENATVKGNVVIIGGSLTMNGSATGDAVVIGGLMTMGDKSSVAGNVTTVGGSLQRAAGAQVGGQIVNNASPNIQTPTTPNVPAPQPYVNTAFSPILQAFGVFGMAILFAALAMLLVIFLHPQLDRVAQAIVAEPIIAGGIGLLTSFVSPIALVIVVVILVLTLILIPVAVLAVVVWAILIALAWLFGIIALGMEVGDRFTKAIHQS
ncbi:MAG TPA: polymer-forming cytoskeletal protein, partial [Anaerolineales bacterium]